MRRKTDITRIIRDPDRVNYKALCHCPFCGEAQASLIADSKTNRWECQACAEKGSVYQHVEKLTLVLDTDRDISRTNRTRFADKP